MISWGRLLRVGPVSPCLPFPFPPSLSHHSPTSLTLNQIDYLRMWSLKFNCQRNILLVNSQTPSFQNLFSSGISLCIYRTTFAWSQLQRQRQWQRAYRRRPTTFKRKKKRQRWKHAHHRQQFTRAQFPYCRFPAKFGCQPIKLELCLLAHGYPANYVRVHLRHLWVYKDSQAA